MPKDIASPVLDELTDLGERALVEITSLEERKAELDAMIKRLKDFVRSQGMNLPAKQTVSRNGGTRTRGIRSGSTSISPERMLQVGEAILTLGRQFTVPELHREILGNPWSEPSTYMAVKYMRGIEFVAAAGKDRATGRNIYQVLDPERINDIKAMANGAS